MNKPVIFYSGNTVVRPGNIVTIRGEYLDTVKKITVSDGKNSAEAEMIQPCKQSVKFPIPAGLNEGVYTVSFVGEAEEVTRILNAPVVRWIQGDEGKTATSGGWIRVNGECMRVNGDRSPSISIGETTLLPTKIFDDYSVLFELPEMADGEYDVIYSNGYAECSGLKLTVAPSPEASWPKTVYNVVEEGFPTDQITDVTENLQALLKKVGEAGGGIIYFPRGRYHVTGQFDIPKGTVIRGEGYTKSQIFWTDEWNERKNYPEGEHWAPTRTPDGMLRSEGDFAIEDIDFAASRIGSFIMAGEEDKPVANIRIDNVRISANAFFGWYLHSRCGGHFHQARCDVLWETMRCRTDMISICGDNIKIRNCDFQWSARPFAERGGISNLLMQNIKFGGQAAVDDWMPFGRLNNAIIEDCDIHEWTGGCSGTNIYYARVKIQDVVDNNREALTTDIAYGTQYHGPMVKIEGNTFYFPGGMIHEEVDRFKPRVGGTLCILSGTGAGQFRRISAIDFEAMTVTIDTPFEVQPDETSHIVANDMFQNWYFVNNTIENSGSLQFYTAQYNTVVDGTNFIRSASIKSWGQFVYGTISNQWYISFINNKLSDCNYYHFTGWYMAPTLPGASFLCCFGEDDETTSMALTMRNNELGTNSAINMRGGECEHGVEDLVIDSNKFDGCRCGIYLENKGERILITGNEFTDCDKPVEFTDSATEARSEIRI
ncbi:MAG: hypothetical protein E7628_05340 [Ruminococcaceae bacterium]|nr:hypothetical protein [Oscillospiraceae bacterium]